MKLFAKTFNMHALEEAIKGNNIELLFKEPMEVLPLKEAYPNYKCESCGKNFKKNYAH